MLFDRDIINAVASGVIRIEPFNHKMLGPSGIDVTLLDEFRVPSQHGRMIRPHNLDAEAEGAEGSGGGVWVSCKQDGIVLPPLSFVLGSTVEYVELGASHCCEFTGRSSWGRWGVAMHITAGHIDAGFRGRITLEIFNNSPWHIQLQAGDRIGQLLFFRGDHPANKLYEGKYNGQEGPVPSRLHTEPSPRKWGEPLC